MQVGVEEIAALLGQKDIEILVLQKQIKALTDQLNTKTTSDGGVNVTTVGQTGGVTAANVP